MSLQVIGAGFGRTGTKSLQVALEILGFGPCYHMVEVLPKGPKEFSLWEQAGLGNADWESIFGSYKATVDFPGCTFWKELSDFYPEAKVLLSVRDADRWFQSTQETIFSPRWIEYLKKSSAAKFMDITICNQFGGNMHDRENLVRQFQQHNTEVKAAIAPERLLTFEVKQGWEPLCNFLGVAEPREPFPHVNDTEETIKLIDYMIEHGLEKTFGY
jgi:hypothetical protein